MYVGGFESQAQVPKINKNLMKTQARSTPYDQCTSMTLMAWENLEIEPIMIGAYNVLGIQCVP